MGISSDKTLTSVQVYFRGAVLVKGCSGGRCGESWSSSYTLRWPTASVG